MNDTIESLIEELKGHGFVGGFGDVLRSALSRARNLGIEECVKMVEEEYDKVLGTAHDGDANGLVAAIMALKALDKLKE